MVAREYARFCCWMVGHLGESDQVLVDTFCASLAVEYAAGQYPYPPVGQILESLASSPSDGHGGSSSSVDELFEDDESADVADSGDLIQGNSHAPAVHFLLTGGLVATMAGVVAHADAVVAGSSSDGFDMEPLF